MAEKIAKLGIKREPGFLYFLRGTNVFKTPEKRGGGPSAAGKATMVAPGNWEREEGYLYFLDANGDISRARRAVGRSRPAAKSKTKTPAQTSGSAVPYRRSVLEQLGRDRLAELSERFHLEVADRRCAKDHIDAILRDADFSEVLRALKYAELKQICSTLSLDSGGREPADLIKRLLSLGGVSKASGEEEPAKANQATSSQPSDRAPAREGLAVEAAPQRSTRERSKVFISYSHADKDWLHRLQIHLKPLQRDVGIECWDDERIKAGMKWRAEIERAIAEARVAVLLVSSDFLASSFVANDELPPLLAAAEKEGLAVLPLILRPCRFVQTKSLSEFQAFNPPDRTLAAMQQYEWEHIFVKVTDRIEELLRGNEPRMA